MNTENSYKHFLTTEKYLWNLFLTNNPLPPFILNSRINLSVYYFVVCTVRNYEKISCSRVLLCVLYEYEINVMANDAVKRISL